MPEVKIANATFWQLEVCNACRYCEGYCAVFPALEKRRRFTPGDVVYLANLCHDCRACFYACMYAPPHEFGVNIPKALQKFASARTRTTRCRGWFRTWRSAMPGCSSARRC